MTVERVWRWTCNTCGRTVEVLERGVPRGWMYVADRIAGMRHCCERCAPHDPACKVPLGVAEDEPHVVEEGSR